MRRRDWLAMAALALVGCGGDGDSRGIRSVVDDVQVELVGAGVVSTELPEFASALTPEGDTIFFNRTPADRSRLDLYMSVRVDGQWTEARLFEPTAGETAIDPFLSLDGQRLYFTANRSVDGTAEPSFGLWYVDRSTGAWGPPTPLPPPVNSASSETANSLAADGTLVFSSSRNGERRIYTSRLRDGAWTEPALVTFGSSPVAFNAAINADGTFMVLAAPGPDDGSDLFVSCRTPDGWAERRRLPPPISSTFADFAPGISGAYLYFTSERPGVVGPQPDSVRPPGDLYRTPLETAAALCRPGIDPGTPAP